MPSMPKAIEHTIQNHVAMITMNNPPANTWTADSLHALKALVCTLNQNKDVYALVITGSGDKFFSAGADLKLFADGDKARALEMVKHLKLSPSFEVYLLLPLMVMPWVVG